MKSIYKKTVAVILTVAMTVGCTSCGHKDKKEKKPEPKTTTIVDDGNANAGGSGDGQSDTPLVIGCDALKKNFNPFSVRTQSDKTAVNLTQAFLVRNDRTGEIIYKGIDGEVREFNGNSYTYYGAADIDVKYRKKVDETVYTISLRDDLVFSDGEKIDINDVIFTMYAFCDSSYNGDVDLGTRNIKGLKKYQKKKSVKNISGIKRLNRYKMTITTEGFDKNMIYSLRIPICPLHYYGDTSKYKYNKNKFGFKKGDISQVCANRTSPVGAGPYRFVKYEKGIIYYTSNEMYYLGCPQIAFVQLKAMGDALNKAQEKIDKSISDGNATFSPDAEVNHVAEATEISEGTVDILTRDLTQTDLEWITAINSNGKISGGTLVTRFVSSQEYNYVGINADKVNVAGKKNSKKSKYLRRALATAISFYKSELTDYYGYGTNLINYPYASTSWLSPQEDDDDYKLAYNTDIDGKEVYDEDNDIEKTAESVKQVILEYLEAAGYVVEDDMAKAAPQGASLNYHIWVPEGEQNPMHQVLTDASALLDEVGITLELQSMSDYDTLEERLHYGSQQLWCGKNDTSGDYDLYERYSARENIFGLSDIKLNKITSGIRSSVKDENIRKRYGRFFERLSSNVVEVPVYQVQRGELFSSSRIDMDTMTVDVTPYYGWMEEIQNVEMKS